MEEIKTKIIHGEMEEITRTLEGIESDTIVIITEPNVWGHHGNILKNFKIEGKNILQYKAPSGESCKSFLEYERCIQFLISKKVHRKSHLFAIGGGALSDLAGFVAATYLRGIRWSIAPTTLLSMIDACLGGKVAINVNETKNMVGSFHQPDKILIVKDFLKTLPIDQKTSALGEVAKYALLEPPIYEKITYGHNVEEIIEDCLQYKYSIVEEDPLEKNVRRLLNLGHTFGHALENYYGLAHGLAVFWGMVIEAIIFENKDYIDKLKILNAKLEITNGEPPWLNRTFPKDDLMTTVLNDKKVVSSKEIKLPLYKDSTFKVESVLLNELGNKLDNKIEYIRTFKL